MYYNLLTSSSDMSVLFFPLLSSKCGLIINGVSRMRCTDVQLRTFAVYKVSLHLCYFAPGFNIVTFPHLDANSCSGLTAFCLHHIPWVLHVIVDCACQSAQLCKQSQVHISVVLRGRCSHFVWKGWSLKEEDENVSKLQATVYFCSSHFVRHFPWLLTSGEPLHTSMEAMHKWCISVLRCCCGLRSLLFCSRALSCNITYLNV